MLTVHKLHPAHQLLAENAVAKDARDHGIEEVLVVIHRGAVIRVQTPPGMVSEFVPEDDWMFSAIREAYVLGANDEHDDGPMLAPPGWTCWADLQPGTVAVNGDRNGLVLVYGSPALFEGHIRHMPSSAAWLWANRVTGAHVFNYDSDNPPALPFVRVLATGLDDAKLREVTREHRKGQRSIAYILGLTPGDE